MKIKKRIESNIKKEENEIKDIFRRLIKRDFSGNSGLAIKNSVYLFSRTIFSKVGSLIFTIILARLLMPELFGLYSLALSTIILFCAISSLGIGQAIVRYVSKSLSENKKNKSKNYIKYFGKIKIVFTLIAISLLLIFSKFISENYYQKPILLALLAGLFYIIFIRIDEFFSSILNSFNDFKNTFYKEIIFQISRIILVPLAVIYSLKISISEEFILFYVILFLAISYLISGLFLFFITKREAKKRLNHPTIKKDFLSIKEKKDANKFLILSSLIVFSGTFFGNIDKIMLGRFVSGEFIGYYQAAFSLIGALAILGSFGAILLPIFSRMKTNAREKAMKKSLRLTLLLNILVLILAVLFSSLIIKIAYGVGYIQAVNVLRFLSILIVIIPLTGIYTTYFISKNKPEIVAISLGIFTLINIVLNYILITSLLPYGELQAVYGAAIATLISKFFYLGVLGFSTKKKN